MQTDKKQAPGFCRVLRSTLAAALGVQNDQNRISDFETGSPFPYIVAGIVFTLVFISSIILIVKYLVL